MDINVIIHNALESTYALDCFDFEIIDDNSIKIYADEIEAFLEFFTEEIAPDGSTYLVEYDRDLVDFSSEIEITFIPDGLGRITATSNNGEVKIVITYEE